MLRYVTTNPGKVREAEEYLTDGSLGNTASNSQSSSSASSAIPCPCDWTE